MDQKPPWKTIKAVLIWMIVFNLSTGCTQKGAGSVSITTTPTIDKTSPGPSSSPSDGKTSPASTPVLEMGGDSSGGGATVVCRDSTGRVTQAQLLDLYEAENSKDKTKLKKIVRSEDPADQQIEEMFRRWEQRILLLQKGASFSQRRYRSDLISVRRALSVVERDWKTITPGQSLPYLADVFPKTPWRDQSSKKIQCTTETSAIYDDDINTLYVNSEIYDKLSSTDQAALKVHEAIYKLNRSYSKDHQSTESREAVSFLFSEVQPEDPGPDFSTKIAAILEHFNDDGDGKFSDNNASALTVSFLLGNKQLLCSPKNNDTSKLIFQVRKKTSQDPNFDPKTNAYVLSSTAPQGLWPQDDTDHDNSETDVYHLEQVWNNENQSVDFLNINGLMDFDEGDIQLMANIRMPFSQIYSDENFTSGRPFDGGLLTVYSDRDRGQPRKPRETQLLSCQFVAK